MSSLICQGVLQRDFIEGLSWVVVSCIDDLYIVGYLAGVSVLEAYRQQNLCNWDLLDSEDGIETTGGTNTLAIAHVSCERGAAVSMVGESAVYHQISHDFYAIIGMITYRRDQIRLSQHTVHLESLKGHQCGRYRPGWGCSR